MEVFLTALLDVTACTDLHMLDRHDMRGCVHWTLLHLTAKCLLLFLILVLQVLVHAARNFALQEHAIENTESVSLPHIMQYDYSMTLHYISQSLILVLIMWDV